MDERAALEDLARFPLLAALFGRRSRRFGVGMSIPDGPLAYASSQPPLPLMDLERTLLVLCGAGVSGWHLGMEHTATGDPHHGCNYPVRLTGRVAASAAGIETSELIVTDDAGTFITSFRDLDPMRLQELQAASDLGELLRRADTHCTRLSDGRVQLPATTPHMDAHNFWNANRPGTTLFIPIVDLTQQLLEFLAIQMAEGVVPWDPMRNQPWQSRALHPIRVTRLAAAGIDRRYRTVRADHWGDRAGPDLPEHRAGNAGDGAWRLDVHWSQRT